MKTEQLTLADKREEERSLTTDKHTLREEWRLGRDGLVINRDLSP